ncbi:conserved hypothetical protein [Neospora caninum Liverpool]|nr:conserved hypothetical protein [Neospora caninum Liverpool]CBZ54734.1 conserved hypothetical protein [Neospora caninum Liverpool]|eukprot:XP_003884762.1 conserved hypothetical protein [Neospora caninum Liverpool]
MVAAANLAPFSWSHVSSLRCFVSSPNCRSDQRRRSPEPGCTDTHWTIPLYYVATLAEARLSVEWILSCCKEASSGGVCCSAAPPPQLPLLAVLPETSATRQFQDRFRDSTETVGALPVFPSFGTPGQDYADVLGDAADPSGHAGISGSSTRPRSRLFQSSIGVHVPFLPLSRRVASLPHALRPPSPSSSSPAAPGLRDDSLLELSHGEFLKGTRKEDARDSYLDESRRFLHYPGRTELLSSLYVSTPRAIFLFSFCPSLSSSPDAVSHPVSPLSPSPSSSFSSLSSSSLREHRRLVCFVCSSLLANPDVAKVSHGAHGLMSTLYWQYGVSASTFVDSQVGLASLLDRLNLESNFLSLFTALRLQFGRALDGWDRLVHEEKESSLSVASSSPAPDGSLATGPGSRRFADASERGRVLQNEGGGLHEAMLAAHTLPFGAHVCSLLGDDDGAFFQAQMESILLAYSRMNPDLSTPRVPRFSRLAEGGACSAATSEAGKDRPEMRRLRFAGYLRAVSAAHRHELEPPIPEESASVPTVSALSQAPDQGEQEEEGDAGWQAVRLLPVPPGTVLKAMLMYRETEMLFFGLNLGPLAGVAVGKSISRFPDLKPGDVVDCCVLGRSPCGQFLLLERVGGRNLVFDLKSKRMLPLPSLGDTEATSSSSTFSQQRKNPSSQSSSSLVDDASMTITPGAYDEPYKLTSNASLVDMKARFTVGLDERLGKRFGDNGGRPKPYIGQKIYKLGKRGAVKIRKKLPRNVFDDDGRNK